MGRIWRATARKPIVRLTLFGRSLVLIVSELLANAICWCVCAILFGRRQDTRSILSLALLAWTIGLRHALDADHISAIDNATRNLISLGQLPVTCGLFFSLGHSTIVIAVNVAIAISTDVYDHIGGVGQVGGIVGTAISASFLFIIGLANSIILAKVVARRRKRQKNEALYHANKSVTLEQGGDEFDEEPIANGNTLMMRILGPIVQFVDRPWKMYPVGVLFGFGFDTASSIALLAVSAIAKTSGNGADIAPANIIILPVLFTVGMTLIDSVDSVIMLYSYSGFPERSFAIFQKGPPAAVKTESEKVLDPGDEEDAIKAAAENVPNVDQAVVEIARECDGQQITANEKLQPDQEFSPVLVSAHAVDEQFQRDLRLKRNAISNLSIVLTLMSILVAFSISLIEIMGLIGDNCGPCQKAANDPNGGGLAGRWWRGWDEANNDSGYIGAAIVGVFVFIVGGWYGTRYLLKRLRSRHQ